MISIDSYSDVATRPQDFTNGDIYRFQSFAFFLKR